MIIDPKRVFVQISESLSSSLHYQVQREYNMTAKHANATSQETLRITVAWDSLQNQVSTSTIPMISLYLEAHFKKFSGLKK